MVERDRPAATEGGNGLAMVLTALRRRVWVVVLVALPVVLGATWYAQSRPSEYEGLAVVSFAPRTEAGVSAELIRLLLPRYGVYADSVQTARRAAEEADVPTAGVRSGLDAVVPEGAAHIEIRVRLSSPEAAAGAANAVAGEVVRFARSDPLLSASVVTEAEPPGSPAGPFRLAIEIAALAVGLLLGIGAAVLLEQLRPPARSAGDIALHSGLPVMGSLPPSSAADLAPEAALADPTLGFHIRRLRTNLRAWPGEEGPGRVLAVTSSVPGEGRTTVATLLATSIAMAGARVLLVDGDLVDPELAGRLALSPVPGLAETLRDETSFAVARYQGVPGLAVLTTSPDEGAGDLLAHRLQVVLDEARSRYDFVIVDTPALLESDEARTFAALADGVLLVVSPGRSAAELQETATVLGSLEASVSGVVANGGARPGRDVVRREEVVDRPTG